MLFFALLIGLHRSGQSAHRSRRAFYRAGSLALGGGHVVLPLSQAEVVPSGWVTNDQFLAGYGAAQVMPGPLFTFAAYLGAVIGGKSTATLCLVAVFLPWSYWWSARCRSGKRLGGKPARSALRGVNAAVAGLLLAALYHPVWAAGTTSAKDFALAIAAFLLLYMWQTTPWLVVILSAAGTSLALLPASIF
jgi:chromate transporter